MQPEPLRPDGGERPTDARPRDVDTEGHPLTEQLDAWEAVIEDMETTAAEYREEGWETVELHPGDVAAIPSARTPELDDAERFGLDVLVPGEEFETLAAVVEGADFDAYDAFRAVHGGVVFLLVAMQSEATRTAVFLPLYYVASKADPMIDAAREANALYTYVRPLSDDEQVVFRQADPDRLLP